MASQSANNIATDDLEDNGASINTDSLDKKIKHKATSNKPAPLGHDYEIYILILTCLDAIEKKNKHKRDFNSYIGAEVLETSPFEDIVYVEIHQKEATSWYIQAKHSLVSFPIKLDELLTDNSKRDKICLLKYFECIRNIKKSLKQANSYYSKIKEKTKFTKESHKFVIFTNRPLHKEVTGLKDVTDDILFYTCVEMKDKQNEASKDSDSHKSKTHLMMSKLCKCEPSDNSNSLYQRTKTSLTNKAKEKKDFTFTENELREFFEDIIFATGQPNVNKLKLRVENKLREITNLPETKWIANTLAIQLSQWAHQKDGWFLDRNTKLFEYINQHLASWRQTVHTLNIMDSIKRHGVAFKNDTKVMQEITNFINRTNKDEPQICVVYYEHLKLTEMKIVQAINDKIKYEITFFNLEGLNIKEPKSYFNVIEVFESEASKFLIIRVNNQSEWVYFLNIATQFFEILKKHCNKKIILVVPQNLERLSYDHKVVEDIENSFCDLSKEAYEDLLKERAVLVKDQKIYLYSILDENVEKKINGELLADVIRGDIVINTTHILDEYIRDNIKNYYVPRQLRRIRIHTNILKLKEQFCFLNGSDDDYDKINEKCDIILITENNDVSAFDKICEKKQKSNIHWLIKKQNSILYWQKSQGSTIHIRNYTYEWSSETSKKYAKSKFTHQIHKYVNLMPDIFSKSHDDMIYDDSESDEQEEFDNSETKGSTSDKDISEDSEPDEQEEFDNSETKGSTSDKDISEDSEPDEQEEFDNSETKGSTSEKYIISEDLSSRDSLSSLSEEEKYTEVKNLDKPSTSGLKQFNEKNITESKEVNDLIKYEINHQMAMDLQNSKTNQDKSEPENQKKYGKTNYLTNYPKISDLLSYYRLHSTDEELDNLYTTKEIKKIGTLLKENMHKFNDKRISNSDFVTLEDIENRVIVITAEPGMGKSTLLSHFENSIKSTNAYKEQILLVAKTNLASHSSEFRKLSKTNVTIQDAIKFLLASLNFESEILSNSHLLKFDQVGRLWLLPEENINGRIALYLKVFAHFYNEHKIIALLDGLDEIAPTYNKQVP